MSSCKSNANLTEERENLSKKNEQRERVAMFCSCYHSITKPIVANSTHPPQNPDSSSPQQISIPQKPSLDSPNAKNSLPRNTLRRRPPQPSVMQIEQAVGAGSFRDGEPNPRMNKDSDMKKTTEDLFLGQASEGQLQKKLRETGEWLGDHAETRFRSARKGILIFAFQWIMPIWAISLLIASGTIKLPFSSPFLDDLLL